MNERIREPVVAGVFYPGDPVRLHETLAGYFGDGFRVEARFLDSPVGLIAPHAGYMYSGAVAAEGYARVAAMGRPDLVLFLGANHSGFGEPVSLSDHSTWRTPLGSSPVDSAIVGELVREGMPVANAAFAHEHSIEVQLPFVQHVWGCDLPIVPLCVMTDDPTLLEASATKLASVLAGRSALIVASSDFTHYEPDVTARALDELALDRILASEPGGFLQLVRERRLSICGSGAIAMLLNLCRALDCRTSTMIRYATSGDVTGDRDAVVGYASVAFSTEDS